MCSATTASDTRRPLAISAGRYTGGIRRATQPYPSVETAASSAEDILVWPQEFQRERYFREQGSTVGEGVIGDFGSLKQFRTEDPDVQRFLIRAYQYVIARFDCDGFRIDTLRYLQGDLPRLFGNAMREFALSIGKKNFFTFGEVFDGRAEQDIALFIGRNTQSPGDGSIVGVDAALDYPLFNVAKAVLKGFSAPQALVDMYQFRKQVEQNVVSSHGEATRFFVTFLDNHDNKERFYHVDPANPRALDDQVTAAFACLYSLQGIPCLYYGTEQQLHGAGSDELVREALWGKVPAFDRTNPFFVALRAVAQARASQPALRYGRQYFRPISGDGRTFGISTMAPGVVSFSRILNDEEVVVAVNVADSPVEAFVIVDSTLNPAGSVFQIVYTNEASAAPPDAVATLGAGGTLTIHEVDGSTTDGPVSALRVRLGRRGAQILARR